MKWSIFIIAAFLALAIDRSFMGALELGGVQPWTTAAVAVYVALLAPKMTALWACWLLGLMVDLGSPMADGSVHLVGPHALGYAFGGYLVLLLRSMVFRRRVLTIALMSTLHLLAAALIVVIILVARSWFEATAGAWPIDSAMRELWRRMLTALYSGVIALPVGWALIRTFPLWGFTGLGHRTAAWR